MPDQPAVLVPIHPGEILLEEFLRPAGVTPSAFAERVGISYLTIMDVIEGRTPMSSYLAKRIAPALGTSVEMWVNLQADYEKVEPALKRFQRAYPENTLVEHLRAAGMDEVALETVLQCLKKVCTKCFEDQPEGPCYCCDY